MMPSRVYLFIYFPLRLYSYASLSRRCCSPRFEASNFSLKKHGHPRNNVEKKANRILSLLMSRCLVLAVSPSNVERRGEKATEENPVYVGSGV